MQNLTPATDFYKKFALDCAAEQVAVDLFLLSGQYADIATLSKCALQTKYLSLTVRPCCFCFFIYSFFCVCYFYFL